MNNEAKLIACFASALGIDQELIHDDLTYNTLANWSSVSHMSLITELEEQFQIMLEPEDIISLSSFKKAREILSKNGISFTWSY